MLNFVTPKVLVGLGALFLVISFVTFLSAVGSWRTIGNIPWIFIGYAGMNLMLGIGLLMKERWALYLLGLNAAGYTLLHAISVLAGANDDLVGMGVNILTAAGVWGVVYVGRRHLTESAWGRGQAFAFFVLWMLTYVDSFVNIMRY